MSFKCCFKCKRELPLKEFYRHFAMKDGRLGKCKECAKTDVSAHRLLNIKRIRAYDRKRGSRQTVVDLRKYRERFPGRYRATIAVQKAIRIGVLVPEPCFICGEKAQAHHPDYDQPLDVVWLCSPHHAQTHALCR